MIDQPLPLIPQTLPPHFRWSRGMMTDRGQVVFLAADKEDDLGCVRLADARGVVRHVYAAEMADYRPNLSDPATVGALAALVREAWSCAFAYAVCQDAGQDAVWTVHINNGNGDTFAGPTEAAAWWAALVAAK